MKYFPFLLLFPFAAAVAYVPVAVHDGGTVRGRVHCGAHGETLPVTKDKQHCGGHGVCARLVTDKKGGVCNAVVYLESVPRGKGWNGAKPVLAQHHCAYNPHVLVAPLGGSIEIENDDPILHNVHGNDATHGDVSLFNVAQPMRGQRSSVSLAAMKSPGIINLSCDAGHPWMSGYIFVAPHPYYAVTNERGEYELDNVPPGTYTLHMWHEGTHVANREMQGPLVRRYRYDAPYETTRQITVGEGGTVVEDFELAIR